MSCFVLKSLPMAIFSNILGNSSTRQVSALKPLVTSINSLEEKIAPLSLDGIREMTETLRKEISSGKSLDDILPEAFAVSSRGFKENSKSETF